MVRRRLPLPARLSSTTPSASLSSSLLSEIGVLPLPPQVVVWSADFPGPGGGGDGGGVVRCRLEGRRGDAEGGGGGGGGGGCSDGQSSSSATTYWNGKMDEGKTARREGGCLGVLRLVGIVVCVEAGVLATNNLQQRACLVDVVVVVGGGEGE